MDGQVFVTGRLQRDARRGRWSLLDRSPEGLGASAAGHTDAPGTALAEPRYSKAESRATIARLSALLMQRVNTSGNIALGQLGHPFRVLELRLDPAVGWRQSFPQRDPGFPIEHLTEPAVIAVS